MSQFAQTGQLVQQGLTGGFSLGQRQQELEMQAGRDQLAVQREGRIAEQDQIQNDMLRQQLAERKRQAAEVLRMQQADDNLMRSMFTAPVAMAAPAGPRPGQTPQGASPGYGQRGDGDGSQQPAQPQVVPTEPANWYDGINPEDIAHASPSLQGIVVRAKGGRLALAQAKQDSLSTYQQMKSAGMHRFAGADTWEEWAMHGVPVDINDAPAAFRDRASNKAEGIKQAMVDLMTIGDDNPSVPGPPPPVDTQRRAQLMGMPPEAVEVFFKDWTAKEKLRIQQQQAQQAYAVVNDPKATPAQRAQAQAVLAAANMPLGQQAQHRPDAGPEFEQDVADLMALHPTITRERAVAYVRSKLHGLSTMEPANISGKLRGGKASTVVIDGPDGPTHILQGNGEVIRWGPGNQWVPLFTAQAEKLVPTDLPGNRITRNALPNWAGGTPDSEVETFESQRKLDVEAKAKELAKQAGFEIEGGSAPTSTGPSSAAGAASQAGSVAAKPVGRSAPAIKGPRAQTPPVAPDSHYPEDAMGQPFMLAPDQVETARQATREAIQALAVNGHKPSAEEIKAWILQNKVQ